jgi:two-component system response regulator RegX3
MSILIVEDNASLAIGVERALRLAGLEVKVAMSVAEALEKLEGTQVILLDIRLPDGTGFDVLERIEREKLPIKAIVLTAAGGEGERERARALGAVDFVEKPFRIGELIEQIQALVQRDG